MAGLARESSFMPTIKCSTCGRQVEISMMGEHICSESDAMAPPLLDPSMPAKTGRMMPPMVDTNAANQSYRIQGQITPGSLSSGSRGISPRTPNGQLVGGGGRPGDYSPRIANDSPPGQSTGRVGGYGAFGEPNEYDADFSSGKQAPPSLMDRIDSIAPGPFNSGRRPSNRGNDMLGAERPGTSASNASSGFGSMRAPRAPRNNGYGGFGPPAERPQEDFEPAPFGMNNRSRTFPRPSEAADTPARTPSAPGPRTDRLGSSANGDRLRRPSRDANTSMAPMQRRRPSGRDPNLFPPPVNLADEFDVGNPYHAPSDSTSSTDSGYSRSDASSQPSSRSSPPRSAGPGADRKPSDTSKIDNLMSDLQSSMSEFQSRGQKSPTTGRPFFNNPFDPPRRPLPPDRGYDPRIDPAVQGQQPRSPLGSPMGSPSFREPVAAARDDQRELPPSPLFPSSRFPPAIAPAASPERSNTTRSRSRSRSRPRDLAMPPASRGDCKSCGLAIRGKSISSADGRLTGRYHKACFVCSTCSEPFSSATFYVLGDEPFCELHYHELNGSLCGSCGNGIEGQYLEDETSKKYHVGCFRCGDCGKVLRDGYFEVNGKAFCEMDAWSRVQQPAPPRQTSPRPGTAGGPGFAPGRGMMGLPSGPGGPRSGPRGGGAPGGLPGGLPGLPGGLPGLPGNRLGPGPRPRMEKRMTRLGMMGS